MSGGGSRGSREDSVESKEDGLSLAAIAAGGGGGNGSGSNSRESTATPKTAATKARTTQVRGVSVFLAESGALAAGVTAAELLVYEWPAGSGERWFLQEQLCPFLGIKSFKRRYPEVQQRLIRDVEERESLREAKVVSETAMELGLTGLRETDVVDAMRADYPEHWKAYSAEVAKRAAEERERGHRELVSITKDAGRLAELRRKAMAAAAAWNAETNETKRRERRAYWELQTNALQRPRKRPLRIEADARPQWGDYPVPLIHGQYGNFYKTYTGEEMRRLPVKSSGEGDDYAPVRRRASPPPIGVSEEEMRQLELAQAREERRQRNPDIAENPGKDGRGSGEEDSLGEKECAFCREEVREGDRYVECASCGSCGHPSCLEMSDAMLEVVRGYPWMCMDCKPCSCCAKLDQEEAMLFCDLCDRGYHTFCVGLSQPPSGLWVCNRFCQGKTAPPASAGRRSADGQAKAGTGPGAPKCSECGVRIHKGNKVHHRSRFKDAGLCNHCVQSRQ